nr:hypothetical protein BaRGS_017214 [Batillaria attramentaria]
MQFECNAAAVDQAIEQVQKVGVDEEVWDEVAPRYCRPGDSPDSLRVLLTAPTGKAAYNIRGITLHTAFCLPANQSLSNYTLRF